PTLPRRVGTLVASPPAVDADRLAGDESGLVRGEEGDHRGDFVGAAKAPHRDRLSALPEADFEVVAVFAPIGADRPRGADRTGADRVDGDPERRQVEGQRFGEADDRGLRGGIGGTMLAGPEGGL